MRATIFATSDLVNWHFGLFFVLSVAAIIFVASELHRIVFRKELHEISRAEKIMFVPASGIVLVFLLMMTVAADVPPDFGPEKTALLFGEDLCAGDADAAGCLVEPNYRGTSYVDWIEEHEEWRGIPSPHPDEPAIPSTSPWLYKGCEHKLTEAADHIDCTIVLSTMKRADEEATEQLLRSAIESELGDGLFRQTMDQIEYCDVYFEIRLSKVRIPTRFLGVRACWRVTNFSYTEGDPHTMKQWFDSNRGRLNTEPLEDVTR